MSAADRYRGTAAWKRGCAEARRAEQVGHDDLVALVADLDANPRPDRVGDHERARHMVGRLARALGVVADVLVDLPLVATPSPDATPSTACSVALAAGSESAGTTAGPRSHHPPTPVGAAAAPSPRRPDR